MNIRLPRWLGLLLVLVLAFFDPERWATWTYRNTITNDGVNSGDHITVIVPGAGNVCILIGGNFLNGDVAGRNALLSHHNVDGNAIRHLLGRPLEAIAAGAARNFPTSEASADGGPASSPPTIIISGTETLNFNLASLAVNQNSDFAVSMLVSGGPPTVTLTSPTDAVEVETENRIV